MPKNVAFIQIQKVATYDSDRKKINLISNKSLRININSVLLIGAAFKEDTDDLRNSPTLDIYKMLHQKDINTFIYDEMVELDEYNSIDNLDDFIPLEFKNSRFLVFIILK